jgi:LacI family transcriptional regulator
VTAPPPSTGRHATIFDVARAAGVSKSTVSNVVRGAEGVAPHTRLRVQEALEQLGYRPNVLARQLVQQRTTTLGVLVGDLGNPFYAEMAKQIERAAAGRGYRAAGILFLSHPADREAARSVVEGRVPVVFVTCAADWGDVVTADDHAGAEMATQHLVDLGHRRIAYFADPIVEDSADRERQAGYRRVMESARLTPSVFHWDRPPGEVLRDARDKQVEGILDGGTTAVFSSNDYGAIELLECADRLGVRVPEELSIVGFDDVVMAGLARINLTTVRQPQDQLAGLAIEVLSGRVEGVVEGGPRRRTLPLELVVRGSTAPPAA